MKDTMIAVKTILIGCVLILLLLSGCVESPDQRYERLTRQGIEHYARREYPEAIAVWEKARSVKPTDGSVLSHISNAYLKLAALPKAVETLNEAVKLAPDRVDVRCELVRLLLVVRDIGEAEAQLVEVQKQAPQAAETQILSGDIALYKNLPDQAEKFYKIAATYPDVADISLIKLAFVYLTEGRTEDAEKTYRMVSDMSPSKVPVLLQMHYFWKFREDFEKAETFIRRAVELEPDNLSIHWDLAEFYYGEGRYEAAQACVEKIIEKTPENRSAAIFLVEILLARNDLQTAAGILDKWAAAGESGMGVAILQGKYHLLSNEPMIAADCFKRAVGLDPALPIAHYLLGLAYLADGRRHLARASLSTALKLDPLFTDAELLLADLYYEQEEFDLALTHAERIAEREKENYRAHLIRGHIHLANGRKKAADEAYAAARKMHPDSAAAIYFSALAAESVQRYGDAAALYRKILDNRPDLADVALCYCRVLIRMGEAGKAKTYFEDAIQRDPQNGYFHYILSETYLALGQPDRAKAALRTAVSLNPRLANAYSRLEAFAEKEGDSQAQMQLLKACIDHNPKEITPYLKLAHLYRREWRWEEAVSVLETGLSRNPDSAWIENALAWIFLEHDQQIDRALALSKSAHEKRPESASISDTLGWAYYKKGLFQQAVWILKEAASREASNAMVAFHLALAHHAAGGDEAAKEHLQHALALNLPTPYRQEAETILKQWVLPPDSSQTPSAEQPSVNITDVGDSKAIFENMAPKIPGSDRALDNGERPFESIDTTASDIGIEALPFQEPGTK